MHEHQHGRNTNHPQTRRTVGWCIRRQSSGLQLHWQTDRQTDGRLERLEVVVRGDLQVQTPTARNKCAMNAPDLHSGVIRLLNKAGGSTAGWLMRRLALGAATERIFSRINYFTVQKTYLSLFLSQVSFLLALLCHSSQIHVVLLLQTNIV